MESFFAALDAFGGSEASPESWLVALREGGDFGQTVAENLAAAWEQWPWVASPLGVDECYNALMASVVTFLACVLVTAATAKTVVLRTVAGAEISEEEIINLGKLEGEFRSRFLRSVMKIGLGADFVQDSASIQARQQAWLEGARAMTAEVENADVWQLWGDSKYDEYRGFEGLWLLLLSDKMSFLWGCFPVKARLLYARACLQLAGPENEEVAMDALSSFMPGWAQISTVEASYPPQDSDGGEANLIRFARRWMYLASLGCSAVVGMSRALKLTTGLGMDVDGQATVPPPSLGIEELSTMVTPLLARVRDGMWNLTEPGTITAPPVLANKSDGLRFLAAQVKDPRSVYKRPAYEST